MQEEGKGSRVFGSGNQARGYKDGGREGERYVERCDICYDNY